MRSASLFIMPKKMPNPPLEKLKPVFIERYKELLGDRYDEFMDYSFSYLRKSIRVNTLKCSVEELKSRLSDRWNLVDVPWCPEGLWISFKGDDEQEERFDIGNIPEHALGYFYVQESASMIPPVVLQAAPGHLVLDMCAAPGSKTSQIAAHMQNEGLLIANDMQGSRLPALGINLQRIGAKNTMVTKMAGQRFGKRGIIFDRILIDAPCSGTGTIRKSMKVLEMWSPKLVSRIAHEQKKLIQAAFDALAVGGEMVYSTCTQEPEENEGVVSWFLGKNETAELLDIELDIIRSPAVTSFQGFEYDPRVAKCLRIYPQDNDSEGFFVAKIRKKA